MFVLSDSFIVIFPLIKQYYKNQSRAILGPSALCLKRLGFLYSSMSCQLLALAQDVHDVALHASFMVMGPCSGNGGIAIRNNKCPL